MTQLVKTLVSVYGYPIWIEVEANRQGDVQLAIMRFNEIMKMLTKDNQVTGPF